LELLFRTKDNNAKIGRLIQLNRDKDWMIGITESTHPREDGIVPSRRNKAKHRLEQESWNDAKVE
jgi:hypothetical protein